MITLLLCIPGTKLPKVQWDDKIFLDKLIHVVLFLVLVFLWCRAYRSINTPRHRRIFLTITLLSIVYGIAMEIVQHYFVQFRSFDVGDMIANSIGCMIGYFIALRKLSPGR